MVGNKAVEEGAVAYANSKSWQSAKTDDHPRNLKGGLDGLTTRRTRVVVRGPFGTRPGQGATENLHMVRSIISNSTLIIMRINHYLMPLGTFTFVSLYVEGKRRALVSGVQYNMVFSFRASWLLYILHAVSLEEGPVNIREDVVSEVEACKWYFTAYKLPFAKNWRVSCY